MAAHQETQTPKAGQRIVQPELSADVVIVESQTPPDQVENLTDQLEIPNTRAVVVVVRDKQSAQPANPQPAGGARRRKKKRRHPDDLEQTPGTAASPEAADGDVRPAARRIPSPASDKRHDCLICGKSFPTHQALGGHMSGHNKVAGGGGKHGARHDDDPAVVAQAVHNILAHRNRTSNAVIFGTGEGAGQEGAVVAGWVKEVSAVADGGQEEEEGAVIGAGHVGAVAAAGRERHEAVQPVAHVCHDCNMTFRSGQALGGHKRKHWYPEKQQARAASAAAPLNFDLNELPAGDADGENRP